MSLSSVVFLYAETWALDLLYADKASADLKLEDMITEGGASENFTLKITIESELSEAEFKAWYNAQVRGRNMCVRLQNASGYERAVNPAQITYSYVGVNDVLKTNYFELVATRAKLIQNDVNLIGSILVKPIEYQKNDGTILVNTFNVFINPNGNLSEILYGKKADIAQASLEESPLILPSGDYYIFVRRKGTNIYSSQRISLPSTNHNQILTQ
ncbi:hypothetical protein [Flectobacillus roseus]|uniref:hypothetical protein n=1 Tax=Flectobacillus roseus TaxID=502259 RepID=UPI0024B86F45|nr:hypothetical protein [Flectobacillus roseus]MDI9870561.1 hypothetical protein [Flectobacillus roseus]